MRRKQLMLGGEIMQINVSKNNIFSNVNMLKNKKVAEIKIPDKELEMKEVKNDLSGKLQISSIGKVLFDTIYNADDLLKSFETFSDSKNLDTAVAKDYERRYRKIKDLVSENPELKNRENELVSQLDKEYEVLIERQSEFLAKDYEDTIDATNATRKMISGKFGVEYTPMDKMQPNVRDGIKAEFVSFFKDITDKIKSGVSADDIKDINVSGNKYIKNVSDINLIGEAAGLAGMRLLKVQTIIINSQILKKPDDETAYQINMLLDRLSTRVNKIKSKSNDYFKQYFIKSLSLNNVLLRVDEKLKEQI